MTFLDRSRRPWSWAAVALLAGAAPLAYAQLNRVPDHPARPRQEYLHQDVPTSNLVTTLNDLDGQGWEIFQVVPVWSFQKDNDDDTRLVPRTYEVFGRRPARLAK